MNYCVTVRSRVGCHSQITDTAHVEATMGFQSVTEALDYIRSQATVNGWRDFTMTTIGDSLNGIPL